MLRYIIHTTFVLSMFMLGNYTSIAAQKSLEEVWHSYIDTSHHYLSKRHYFVMLNDCIQAEIWLTQREPVKGVWKLESQPFRLLEAHPNMTNVFYDMNVNNDLQGILIFQKKGRNDIFGFWQNMSGTLQLMLASSEHSVSKKKTLTASYMEDKHLYQIASPNLTYTFVFSKRDSPYILLNHHLQTGKVINFFNSDKLLSPLDSTSIYESKNSSPSQENPQSFFPFLDDIETYEREYPWVDSCAWKGNMFYSYQYPREMSDFALNMRNEYPSQSIYHFLSFIPTLLDEKWMSGFLKYTDDNGSTFKGVILELESGTEINWEQCVKNESDFRKLLKSKITTQKEMCTQENKEYCHVLNPESPYELTLSPYGIIVHCGNTTQYRRFIIPYKEMKEHKKIFSPINKIISYGSE